MNPDLDWAVWARERQQRTEAVLDRVLPPADSAPRRLHEAMRYSVLGGGKRVRALLAYAAGELAQADPGRVDAVAAALELLHAYSLIHDDLPCMDDDVLRRGKPTCHVRFDEATAMLAGDALQSLAFEVLARDTEGVAAATRVRMVADFAHATGAAGMAGGQAVDLASVGHTLRLDELEAMHRMKTGALIRAAVSLGASCGTGLDAQGHAAASRYATAIGLAFQVIDDVLDVEGSAGELGKTPGKDVAQNKPTYVTLLGLAEAKERAQSLLDAALGELAAFGVRARRLRELAQWIVVRTH